MEMRMNDVILRSLILYMGIFSDVICLTSTKCPSMCKCYVDNRERKTVLCDKGGMIGPLNLENISLSTEIIRITAPDDNLNMLTMSPSFQNYKNLKEIHITKSNIPQLGQHFFWGLTNLSVLNLSQNNITQPLDHNFQGLNKLKELNLDDNRIQSLPSGTFRYLHELKILSVQRNRIKEVVNRIFLEIGNLKVLKLSGNQLEELNPEAFHDIQELRRLECRGCALKRINGNIFNLLNQMTVLDFGENEIKIISSEDLKYLSSLEKIVLDGNQITDINDCFTIIPTLKSLNLAYNALINLSVNVFSKLKLIELDLSYNKLDEISSGAFSDISDSLEWLNLSGNKWKMNGLNELNKLHTLKSLKLSKCGLLEINSEMIPPKVESLDLNGNQLLSLVEQLPYTLRKLDLSNNKFRGISETSMRELDNLQYLNLQNNPWTCDLCFIVALLDRVNKSSSFSDIICHSPQTVKGKRLGAIERSELTWCSGSSYNVEGANYFLISDHGKLQIIAASMSVFLLLITIIIIVVAFYVSTRHVARYYTNEDQLATEEGNILENESPLFCDGELSFKFLLNNEKRVSVSTIGDIKSGQLLLTGPETKN